MKFESFSSNLKEKLVDLPFLDVSSTGSTLPRAIDRLPDLNGNLPSLCLCLSAFVVVVMSCVSVSVLRRHNNRCSNAVSFPEPTLSQAVARQITNTFALDFLNKHE